MAKKLQSPKELRWVGQTFDLVTGDIRSTDGSGEKIKSPEMAAIEEVLGQLPILPERRDHVSSAAFNIASVMMWGELHDQPNCQEDPKGTAGDLDEVQKLHILLRNQCGPRPTVNGHADCTQHPQVARFQASVGECSAWDR